VRQPENEFYFFQAAFLVSPTPFYNIERHVKKQLQSTTLGNKPIFQPNGGKIPPNFFINKASKMMFTPIRKLFKPFNATLAALLLACAAPAWADNEAQFQQANAAYDAGNYKQAFRLWQPLAQQGDASSQNNLGLMYEKGLGVAQNDKQAAVWYQKAAQQGFALAQVSLAVMYEDGRGVAKNDKQAVMWYQKAAQQGDFRAQTNLGVMYAEGRGVAQSYQQAKAWWQKAAQQGDARAQNNLGMMYADGIGVAKNPQQAKAWFQKVLAQPDTPENAEIKADARDNLQALKNNSIR